MNCPFCGASESMLYMIKGKDVYVTGEVFQRPEMFCDACKATTYFEDSSSKGVDDSEDYKLLQELLIAGWNSRKETK